MYLNRDSLIFVYFQETSIMYEFKANWNRIARVRTDTPFLSRHSYKPSKLPLAGLVILILLTLLYSIPLIAQQYNRSFDFRFQMFHDGIESENGLYHELLGPKHFVRGIGGRNLYVSCILSDSLSVYDVKKGGGLFNLRLYHNGEILDGIIQRLDGPYLLSISPNGRYLSVVARESDTLSIYQIDANGSLSHPRTYSHGDFVSDGNSGTIRLELLGLRDSRFHISGEKLFAITTISNSTIAFDVSRNGLINPNIYRNFILPDSDREYIISGSRGIFHPNGKFLYILAKNAIFILSVSPDLQLSLLNIYRNGESLNGINQRINNLHDGVVSVVYNLLYLVDFYNNSLLVYRINDDGMFSEVTVIFYSGQTYNQGVITLSLSFDNRFLYVVNYPLDWIRIYELNEGMPSQYIHYSDGDPYLTDRHFIYFPTTIAFSPDESHLYVSSNQQLSTYRTTPSETYDFFSETLTCENRLEVIDGEHFDILNLIESTNNTIKYYSQSQRDRETDLNLYRQQLAIEINATDSLEENITLDLNNRNERFEVINDEFEQSKKILFAREAELSETQTTYEQELVDYKLTQNKIENDSSSRSSHPIFTLFSILQFSCSPVIFLVLH